VQPDCSHATRRRVPASPARVPASTEAGPQLLVPSERILDGVVEDNRFVTALGASRTFMALADSQTRAGDESAPL